MKKHGRLIRLQVFKYPTNMKQKKIIIILAVVVSVLLIAFVILNVRRNESVTDVTEEIKTLPTGIIAPTNTLQNNELDVVSVTPKDGAQAVNINTSIRITFSRNFKEDEIDFSIGPDAIYSQEIKDNVLIIKPWKPLAEGTLYTYSINFPRDNQKVRLYRFVTEGTLSEVLPDTRSNDLVAEIEEKERINHPDIYITNRTPYEDTTFAIKSDFEPKTPAHYYFIVTSKNNDSDTVEQAVDAWLQLQGLTEEQINGLDIRYQ